MATATAEAVSDEERAGARAAASAGADAFDAGRYAESVDYFERAEALVHSPVHLLYIGRAQVKLGQWIKAQETFIKIKNQGAPAGASRAAQKAVDDAAAELERLTEKMPLVGVKVEGADGKKVRVTVDGKEMPAVLIGVPRPIDPGNHRFRATADGLDSGEVQIAVREGTRETVLLKLKKPEAAAPKPVPAPPPEPTPAAAPEPAAGAEPIADAQPSDPADAAAPEHDKGGGSNGLRIGSYAAFGVGVAGLAAGTVFGLKSKNKADEADELCGGSRDSCALDAGSAQASRATELNDSAGSAQTLSIVGFAVGGVGIAAGVTLLVLSLGDERTEKSSGAIVRPWLGYRSVGVSGQF